MAIVRWMVVALVGGCSFSATLPSGPDGEPPEVVRAPACFESRCRRTTITIDHTKVMGGPHASFPLLVELADPMLSTDAVFTAADGTTLLPFERERLAAGELVAWVRVPSVSSTADTTIHLYAGDPAAADGQDRAAVWNDGYQAVWHLAEATGVMMDSTRNANTAIPANGLALGATGEIAGGIQLDGVDDCLRAPQSTSLASTAGKATLSLWVNFTNPALADYQRLLMSTNTFAGDLHGMEWATNNLGYYYYYPSDAGGASNNYAAILTPFVANTWHYAVITQDYDTKIVELFIDGVQRVLAADNTPTKWAALTTAADWYWGGVPPRAKFLGRLDEIRVSNVVRSADWIATEYANQRAPAAFYRVDAPVGP